MNDVKNLGQVFTPDDIALRMIELRQFYKRILDPSAGNGAFYLKIYDCEGIEIDPQHCPLGCKNIDFFDYPIEEKYETIIGNPPYVAFKNILLETKNKLKGFDKRTNLYVFFIDKCLDHLTDNGELIFITPREFLKATSAIELNKKLYDLGTITHLFDLGDEIIFENYAPNCIIWRFEKNNYSRKTLYNNDTKNFIQMHGQLLFLFGNYSVPFKDLFFVKVGAVSGMDEIYANEMHGNREFVCSHTRFTGKTRKMVYLPQKPSQYLIDNKEKLINRKIKKFDESNWWKWGRDQYNSQSPRIYVNFKTRKKNPFFLHPCKNYDGAVLALFPKKDMDLEKAVHLLNNVDWGELGFMCNNRYIFGQRSLENILLPEEFNDL